MPRRSKARLWTAVALCHWLYLAHHPRSGMRLPPKDLDLEDFDFERAARVADAMGIGQQFDAWEAGQPKDYEQGHSEGLGF